MTRTLCFEIECGEMTCASEPGKFCRFAGSTRFGSTPVCLLFSEDTDKGFKPVELWHKDGWLQRCNQCLRTEKV